jgi:hypothetical protein
VRLIALMRLETSAACFESATFMRRRIAAAELTPEFLAGAAAAHLPPASGARIAPRPNSAAMATLTELDGGG